jgi:hypothetical protein
MRNKILAGAGVKCMVNGVDWGTVVAVQYTIATPREEDRGVDSLLPFELSPTTAQVTGTIQLLKLRGDGGLEAKDIANPLPYLDTEQYFSIQLHDRQTGAIYLSVANASVESQSWNFAAKATVTGQFAFRGLMARADSTR